MTRIEPRRRAHRAAAPCGRKHVVRATEAYTVDLEGMRRALVPLNSAMIVTDAAPAPTCGRSCAGSTPTACSTAATATSTCSAPATTGSRSAAAGRPTGSGPAPTGKARCRPPPRGELRERLITPLPRPARHRDHRGLARRVRRRARLDAGRRAGPRDRPRLGRRLRRRGRRRLQPGRAARCAISCWGATPSSPGCPGSRRRSRPWEPEPLRFAGVRAVNALMVAADRREARTGRPAIAARSGQLSWPDDDLTRLPSCRKC